MVASAAPFANCIPAYSSALAPQVAGIRLIYNPTAGVRKCRWLRFWVDRVSFVETAASGDAQQFAAEITTTTLTPLMKNDAKLIEWWMPAFHVLGWLPTLLLALYLKHTVLS